MRYVFRQRPLTGSALARRAAELGECAAEQGRFWSVHVELMTRSTTLTDCTDKISGLPFQIIKSSIVIINGCVTHFF
jgi:protein-disulfide isomerase